ncbi:hypothetical protein GQ55_2G305600 [Panicum hallii var. hallii]|uniref:Uncharacterized protein n=1 Tax=Panicum hallii var. hallii TaxID=1504633 RepID=A0A2T7EU19_9POAL|nr:hypothetical protein GQ55_2G305600 [Panicum hallii var. hallii]
MYMTARLQKGQCCFFTGVGELNSPPSDTYHESTVFMRPGPVREDPFLDGWLHSPAFWCMICL